LDADLMELSSDPLFVQKRAETLLNILTAKLAFDESQCLKAAEPLRQLLTHGKGERALAIALQEVRKAGLSSRVADVSVCGAVAPYNTLLGGKLVAMLVASREVRDAYRDRYAGQPSIISSQMAGRPIFRSAELQVLTTTSLYGNGSSQYNRIRLSKAKYPDLSHDLVWHELDKTLGYGTHHLAASTMKLLREVTERHHNARRINNRFGEGASPRLRQAREGLEVLGVDPSQVMDHATPRLFYACELHPDARDVLLGMSAGRAGHEPVAADALSDAWRRRWLVRRIASPGVLDRVATTGAATFATQLTVGAPDEPECEFAAAAVA
jgi:hypothetical protein